MCASPLRSGQAVSVAHIVGTQQEVVGVIVKSTPTGLGIDLVQLTSPVSFKEEDLVQIKFWDEGQIHFWKGEVLETFGPEGQSILVSRPKKVQVERRRFQRYTIEIPLSFTVVYAGERRVVAREVFNAKTKTLSAGAVQFETAVSLKQNEILDLKLYLSESQQVSVMGKVTRFSESLEGTPVNSVVVRFLALKPEDHDRIETFVGGNGKDKDSAN